MQKSHIFLCIDLKSFYASVECVERGLNSLTTDLVVADETRGRGALCLAVSSSLKKKGVKNRCRLFEIPQELSYLIAKPRMKKYIEYSADIYSLYLRYIAKEDIHVYSIDECFLDITSYLQLYQKTPMEMAEFLMNLIWKEKGIRATAGIGTNMFLAKVALDIVAKTSMNYMGYLDEEIFKDTLWHYQPITDFWNIGRGIAKRLLKYNVTDMYALAHLDEKILYKEFGINALFLIDHAWGRESCTIQDIHQYVRENHSLSSGQVLFENYRTEDAFLAMKEMVELLTLELVKKHMVTNSIYLSIGYADEKIPYSKGHRSLDGFTSSYRKLLSAYKKLFYEIVLQDTLIRKLGISFGHVVDESYKTYDLFEEEEEEKEHRSQLAIIEIKERFGKNAILRGMNLEEKATTPKRNKLIGGHNGE